MGDIHIGTILEVDCVNYKVNLVSKTLGPLQNIQFASPCFNTVRGNGFIGMPYPGSKCLIGKLEDGRFIIFAFMAPSQWLTDVNGKKIVTNSGTVGYNSRRPRDWHPGDVGFGGEKFGNFVMAEIDGAIRIQGGPMCKMSFFPEKNNLLETFTDNFKMAVGGNTLDIINDRTSKSSDLQLVARSSPDSSTQVVKLQMGKKADLLKILIDDTIVVSVDKQKAINITGSKFNVDIGGFQLVVNSDGFKVKKGGSDIISVSSNKTVTINNALTVKP